MGFCVDVVGRFISTFFSLRSFIYILTFYRCPYSCPKGRQAITARFIALSHGLIAEVKAGALVFGHDTRKGAARAVKFSGAEITRVFERLFLCPGLGRGCLGAHLPCGAKGGSELVEAEKKRYLCRFCH
jgi:hypothetical protein